MSESARPDNAEQVSADSLTERESAALEILRGVFEAGGLDIQAEARARHSPYLDVELTGRDALETFGRHGSSLDALQYLANLAINRRVGPEIRVILDANSYRRRRADTLENLARQYANQVKERQEECELDPLPAHERRIIHNALLDDPGVRTYSEGDEPDRRVVIAPA
jgi:spoIIIJ-associated protein